jgi:hypothetical protein
VGRRAADILLRDKASHCGGYETIASTGIDPVHREPNDSSVIFNDARTIHVEVAWRSPADSYRILIGAIEGFVEDIELLAIKGRYYAGREPYYLAQSLIVYGQS